MKGNQPHAREISSRSTISLVPAAVIVGVIPVTNDGNCITGAEISTISKPDLYQGLGSFVNNFIYKINFAGMNRLILSSSFHQTCLSLIETAYSNLRRSFDVIMSSPNTTTTSTRLPPSPVSSRIRAVSIVDSDLDHDHITRIPTSTSHRTADFGHPLERTVTPASHRAVPDLAFPYLTTDTSRGGLTQEYRVETRAGFISADDVDRGLRPMRSRATTIHGDRFVLHDREKGGMGDKKLVTFLEGDPQNPRNWSKLYRWGMLNSANSLHLHFSHVISDEENLTNSIINSYYWHRLLRCHSSGSLFCYRYW